MSHACRCCHTPQGPSSQLSSQSMPQRSGSGCWQADLGKWRTQAMNQAAPAPSALVQRQACACGASACWHLAQLNVMHVPRTLNATQGRHLLLDCPGAAHLGPNPGSCTLQSEGTKLFFQIPNTQTGFTCCWTARELSRVHSSMRPTRSVLLTPSVRLICAYS